MNIMKLRESIGLGVLLAMFALGHNAITFATSKDDEARAPELPAGCEHLAVPAGHRVAFKTYAIGVQKYHWNGASWVFDGPEANLFASANFRGRVGTHYSGPTWESNSGSVVISSATTAVPCTPDPTAIPWLRLTAISSNGPGIFDGTTYIQRVNTVGGIRPTDPGTTVGQAVGVPYTTEYYFYRAED